MRSAEKVYLIDTNVILRYLLGDHAKLSPKAEAFMVDVSARKKKAEIPDVVILECIYVLEKYYEIPRSEVVEKLSGILNFSGIANPHKSITLQALVKYENSTIDFVDCLLATLSSPNKPVISFDKDIERLNAFQEVL